jgi:ZIP family zinc transporter
MLEAWFTGVAGSDPLVQALVAGVVIAGLNLLGASLVLVWRDPSQRSLDGALGFAAGVMLSASFTSLILPGIEFGGANGVYEVIAGILLGAVLLDRADRWVPHVHVLITGRERTDQTISEADLAPVLLFIVAITIHNMPEGLAVGVGFGSGNVGEGLALMLAIGIQNIPEGLAVSVAAVNAGFDRLDYAALTGIRAGLVEIPMVLVGAWAVTVSSALLPYAMGFAAGGMLFVISDEIVPETHSNGNERVATLGLMAGVVVMLYLDVALA